MMKRETSKRVTLPNGRTAVARYKRVTRDHLPANICLNCPYRQRAPPRGRRRCIQQQQRGRGSILKFAKKVVKTPVGRELGRMVINELPNLYSKGASKIKKKKN